MSTDTAEVRQLLASLAPALRDAWLAPGVPCRIAGESVTVLFQPETHGEHMLLVQVPGARLDRFAGCVYRIVSGDGTAAVRAGWIGRGGTAWIGSLPPGAYRLELEPRPDEQWLPPPPGPREAESLLVQAPVEFSEGRLYWLHREDCLTLLWAKRQPGALGVMLDHTAASAAARVLVPVDPEQRILPWSSPGDADALRLQLEGTDETLCVPRAWWEAGVRFLAALPFEPATSPIQESLAEIDREVARRRSLLAQASAPLPSDDASRGDQVPRPIPRPPERGRIAAARRARWVVAPFGLAGATPTDRPFADVLSWDAPDGRYYAQLALPVKADLEGGEELPLCFYHARGDQRDTPAAGSDVVGRSLRWLGWERTIPGEAAVAFLCRGVVERLAHADAVDLSVDGVIWPLRDN